MKAAVKRGTLPKYSIFYRETSLVVILMLFACRLLHEPLNINKLSCLYKSLSHVCGGARWTELQLAPNVLLLARHLELELAPKNYKLKLSPLPKTSPDKRFKFQATGYRRPIELAE